MLKMVSPFEKTKKEEKINVCILGGGNIGTLLMADLSQNDNISIRLLTTKPNEWNNYIDVYDSDDILKFTGHIDIISDRPQDVILDADIILSTLPSHVFPDVLRKIKMFIKPDAWIGMMPGSGGNEFYLRELVHNGCTLFGFQRVHGISRLKVYGKSVYDLGRKTELYIASIPSKMASIVADTMESMLSIKCYSLENYLSVTLTPSNPILHTSRLYSLFHDYDGSFIWESEPYFYSDWTDEASEILISCDEELQRFCAMIKEIDLAAVKSLKVHYESNTSAEMTKKIRSIKAFKGIKAPMIEKENGYIPDFNSRYFKEDFPYGLCIIKSFCDIAKIDTPMINQILKWFQVKNNVNYFIQDKFEGKDLNELPIPQNFGLKCLEDIVEFYTQKVES